MGAPWDDVNGSYSGSVYRFEIPSGRPLARLVPDDGEQGDYFGGSLAVSGSRILVGASGDDDNGVSSGSAYLFDRQTASQVAKLKPCDGSWGYGFGCAVALSDRLAVIGSSGDDVHGSWSGSAYLFDSETGKELVKMTPSDGEYLGRFGSSLCIAGGQVMVGALGNTRSGITGGSAYVFDCTGMDGGEAHAATLSSGFYLDFYGARGNAYRVQQSEEMQSWRNVSEFIDGGGLWQSYCVDATERKSFYRIVSSF